MDRRIKSGILAAIFTVAVLLSYGVPYSYGLSQFTLYGNVIDGGTCSPIVGAMVTAPYNSNTTNITNSTGGYLLRLGYGNWSVTVSKSGYRSITFNTPYVATGSYQVNTYLLMPGSTAANCTKNRSAPNSTTVLTSTAAPTTVVTSNPTTSVQATQGPSNTNSMQTELIAGIGIIVVIIIVAIGYFALRKKGSGGKKEEAPKKEEEKKQ